MSDQKLTVDITSRSPGDFPDIQALTAPYVSRQTFNKMTICNVQFTLCQVKNRKPEVDMTGHGDVFAKNEITVFKSHNSASFEYIKFKFAG